MWYYAPKTGRYVPEGYLDNVDEVYGEGTSKVLIRDRKVVVAKNSSVIDIYKSTKSKVHAVRRYREIHGCRLKEAIDMVTKIIEDIERMGKKCEKKEAEEK